MLCNYNLLKEDYAPLNITEEGWSKMFWYFTINMQSKYTSLPASFIQLLIE